MYNLYKLNENLYQIHSSFVGETAMEGTLLAILTYAVYTLRFDIRELERGLIDMLDNNNNGANFGMNRTFIYSFNRFEKKVG